MNPFSASVETGVNFLAELYHTGVGYSAINTARCALSTCLLIDGCRSFGSHPLVSRFINGVFESRPALPKYSETWDVKQVFSYLQTLHPPESLTLKDLTHKVGYAIGSFVKTETPNTALPECVRYEIKP